MLLNLVTNAIKFTDEGWVLIRFFFDDTLIVEVEDSGCGIDCAFIKTLFKPFVQGDNSITRRVGGSGFSFSLSMQTALF